MEHLISTKPYTMNRHQPLEAHFGTLSLEDLRNIQQKRDKEEQKVDLSPECIFMENDKKQLDRLISATVVDIVKSKRKAGRPKSNKK
jgi:hypothetical protein